MLTGFPGSSDGKVSAYNAGDRVRSLGWEDPLVKEMATHSGTLAWKIPWPRSLVGYSPWGRRVRHDWARGQALLCCSGSRLQYVPQCLCRLPSTAILNCSVVVPRWDVHSIFHTGASSLKCRGHTSACHTLWASETRLSTKEKEKTG